MAALLAQTVETRRIRALQPLHSLNQVRLGPCSPSKQFFAVVAPADHVINRSGVFDSLLSFSCPDSNKEQRAIWRLYRVQIVLLTEIDLSGL